MTEKKGVIAIIFDHSDNYYFLIVHKNVPAKKGWEFVKGIYEGDDSLGAVKEEIDDTVGVKYYKVKKKLDWTYAVADSEDVIINDIYLIHTNMNTSVKLDYNPEKLNTYLWGKESSVLDKLTPDHKAILEKALPDIKAL